MNPILIAGALFLFILATSKDGLSNIFNPSKLFDTAAGPGAQQVNKAPTQGKAGQFGPPNYQRGTGTGSPNSTLATVDNSMIVVNNALGFIKNLGEYFGDNEDSEHPVSENIQTTNYAPIDNSQGFSLDSNTFVADSMPTDSSYTQTTMAYLTSEDVNASYAAIMGRANGVIDKLEGQKSLLGDITGNNDTVTQTQGAIHNIVELQMPRWKQNGLDIAAQGDQQSPGKAEGWANVGKEFTKAIGEIDGYGDDATIQSVLSRTAEKSLADTKQIASTWGVPIATAIIASLVLLIVFKVKG